MIYDKNVYWSLARFQFEAKLFLKRCEKRWPRRVHVVLDAPPSILAPGGAALAELSRGGMTATRNEPHNRVTFCLATARSDLFGAPPLVETACVILFVVCPLMHNPVFRSFWR